MRLNQEFEIQWKLQIRDASIFWEMGQIRDFSKSPLFAIIFKVGQIRDFPMKIRYKMLFSGSNRTQSDLQKWFWRLSMSLEWRSLRFWSVFRLILLKFWCKEGTFQESLICHFSITGQIRDKVPYLEFPLYKYPTFFFVVFRSRNQLEAWNFLEAIGLYRIVWYLPDTICTCISFNI